MAWKMAFIWSSLLILILVVEVCLCFPGTEDGENNEMNDGPIPTNDYPNHKQLDSNYHLKWNFNSTHIMLHAHVKSNGTIGLGFSNHTDIYPHDVIIAWVKDGRVHLSDRYATGQVQPPLDDKQDWFLVDGKEEDGYTMITVVRLLDTCDEQDVPISASTVTGIYSYSDRDPDKDDTIDYHDNIRGTKPLLFLDPPPLDMDVKNLPDDVKTIEFFNNNYSVPSNKLTYSCTVKKLPILTQKHHLIRFEAAKQKGHENLVHHIGLFYCIPGVKLDHLVDKMVSCFKIQNEYFEQCYNMFFDLALGENEYTFPLHVGHSLGTPDDPNYFMLQTHFDNTEMRTDFVDNSGVRLYLTPKLRQHDSGIMMVGMRIGNFQVVPPHDEHFLSRGYCHKDCLSEAMGDGDEINVFSVFLHGHLLARSVSTNILRNGEQLPPIVENKNFEYHHGGRRLLAKERIVKKGDTLFTDCYYNSTSRTTITYVGSRNRVLSETNSDVTCASSARKRTFCGLKMIREDHKVRRSGKIKLWQRMVTGGLSSTDEMCTSFLLYYPNTHLSTCRTSFKYRNFNLASGKNMWVLSKSMDFTKKDVRSAFIKYIAKADIQVACSGTRRFVSNNRVTHQPEITKPYKPVSQCERVMREDDPLLHTRFSDWFKEKITVLLRITSKMLHRWTYI